MLYRRFGKRLFDLTLTLPALLVLAPVFLVVAILVRLKLGSPILFRQTRPGLNGHPFTLYKFRTMTNHTNPQGQLLTDAERLTPFGQFLRRASLDELPELWNVVRGEMSLIGPRPLLMEYLERYTPEQMKRHNVLPGLTGWAQINGRNLLTWEDKFAHDLWYIQHVSWFLDCHILFKTLTKLVSREGINQPGEATAQKFTGS